MSTTLNLPFKRYVRQVSYGERVNKSLFIDMEARNLVSLQNATWRESSVKNSAMPTNSVMATDGKFTTYINDKYDAFKQDGDGVATTAEMCGYAGCVAYRFTLPSMETASPIMSITIPVNLDRYQRSGVKIAVALSELSIPSDDWSVIRGTAPGCLATASTPATSVVGVNSWGFGNSSSSGYLLASAARYLSHTFKGDGDAPIFTSEQVSGKKYLYVYMSIEDYTDYWNVYDKDGTKRAYNIEGSAVVSGTSVSIVFSQDGLVAPDEEVKSSPLKNIIKGIFGTVAAGTGVVLYVSTPNFQDSDNDLMPDVWEESFAGLSASTNDSGYFVPGDVMAYAYVNKNIAIVSNATDGAKLRTFALDDYYTVGDAIPSGTKVWDVFEYGTNMFAIGKSYELPGEAYVRNFSSGAKFIVVHSTVKEFFGFNKNTANSTVAMGDRVNTKDFTALDKYLVSRWLASYGLCNESNMISTATWSNYTLKPGTTDGNSDGIPDGWELYNMFNADGAPDTLEHARISPFDTIMGESASEYVRDSSHSPDGSGMTWFEKYNEGDVFNPDTTDSDGDGISDLMSVGRRIGGKSSNLDTDNDGLSNISEYKIWTNAINSSISPTSKRSATPGQVVPDYFIKHGSTYLGFEFSDHDMVEDWWEDMSDVSYSSRFQHDMLSDNDEDGWNTFDECRYALWTRMFPAELSKIAITSTYVEKCRPMPQINAKIHYYGTRVHDVSISPVVIRVSKMGANTDDAIFEEDFSSSGSSKATESLMCEFKSGAKFRGRVDRGWIIPSSVKVVGAEQVASVVADDNLHYGKMYYTGTDNVIGTIDLWTGEYEFDMAALENFYSSTNALEGQKFVIHATTRPISDFPVTIHAVNPKSGKVSGGENFVSAFSDINRNGKWDAGEPFGCVKAHIGWWCAECEIEMTDVDSTIARYDFSNAISGGKIGATNITTDRDVIGYPETNIVVAQTTFSNSVPATALRVRVVRSEINHQVSESYSSDVMLDRTFNVSQRTMLTEADLIAEGLHDLDWGTLVPAWNGGQASSIASATYRVVVGDGTVSGTEVNANLPIAFVNVFETGTRATTTSHKVGYGSPNGLVDAGAPTFNWRHDNGLKDYPAFQLRVWKADGTTLVYDSGVRRAPPRNSQGVYSWTAPLYAGMMTPHGVMFSAQENYKWAVSMLDAKFTEFNTREPKSTFRLNTTGDVNFSDYGKMSVKVKYFGPATVSTVKTNGLIHVEAFTNPDLDGIPVCAGYVTNSADIASATSSPVNSVLNGLYKRGKYYILAWIDTNGNGHRDAWESWGYANMIDDDTDMIYNPKAFSVGECAVVYIDDMDIDNDSLPDAWEFEENRSSDAPFDVLGAPTSISPMSPRINPNLSHD